MLVDVHTHIFPPEIVGNRHRFFHGEPAFELLYASPRAKLAKAEDLLNTMDDCGVEFAVTFGFPWENMELARRHNDYVLESAARYSPRLLPLGCMHPLHKEASSEARRCLESGARGLGELAVYGPLDRQAALPRFGNLAECCRDFKGVLMVHANEPVGHSYPGKAPVGIDFYYAVAGLARGIPLILAHWGGGLCFYELLKREVSQVLESVFYDTAASPLLYRPEIYRHMLDVTGMERILMGSDYPLLSPRRYMEEMEQADLPREALSAIGGENAARLFGIRA
ncbi:MAG: amidohydrolase family protein [Deltaproteobacteria bacterium]|nr:amidohydrolase family protein [Deltaproteobacteria bacterium]